MDRTTSWLPDAADRDPLDRALREIDAAIGMVVAGVAVTMTLCCLDGAEGAAFTGAAWTQAAGVAFGLRRDPRVRSASSSAPGRFLQVVETPFELES